jgi:hypothetical protein
MDIDQGYYSSRVTASGWILTRDTILAGLLCRDGYWPWTLRLGMFLLMCRGGYWHCDLWFCMLFWTMTDITKYHKLWPRIVTRASSLSFPQWWRALPCKCNNVFLCVLDSRLHDEGHESLGRGVKVLVGARTDPLRDPPWRLRASHEGPTRWHPAWPWRHAWISSGTCPDGLVRPMFVSQANKQMNNSLSIILKV